MNRKNKSISFNLLDAYEVGLLAHAEDDKHGDFSKYIKRLIMRDLDARPHVQGEKPMAKVAERTAPDTNAMKMFI